MRRASNKLSRPLTIQSLETRKFLSGVPLSGGLGVVSPERFVVERPAGDMSATELCAPANPAPAIAKFATPLEGPESPTQLAAVGTAFWQGPLAIPKTGISPVLDGVATSGHFGRGFDVPARPVTDLPQYEASVVANSNWSGAPARERTTEELRALDQVYSSNGDDLLSGPAGAATARARTGLGQPLGADGSY